jgi:hypothetical protein
MNVITEILTSVFKCLTPIIWFGLMAWFLPYHLFFTTHLILSVLQNWQLTIPLLTSRKTGSYAYNALKSVISTVSILTVTHSAAWWKFSLNFHVIVQHGALMVLHGFSQTQIRGRPNIYDFWNLCFLSHVLYTNHVLDTWVSVRNYCHLLKGGTKVDNHDRVQLEASNSSISYFLLPDLQKCNRKMVEQFSDCHMEELFTNYPYTIISQ